MSRHTKARLWSVAALKHKAGCKRRRLEKRRRARDRRERIRQQERDLKQALRQVEASNAD